MFAANDPKTWSEGGTSIFQNIPRHQIHNCKEGCEGPKKWEDIFIGSTKHVTLSLNYAVEHYAKFE